MKKYKIFLNLLLICIMFSVVTADAANTVLVTSIEIPAYKGNYTMAEYRTKTMNFEPQYYESAYTEKITASGDEVPVEVRVMKSTGVKTGWVELDKNEIATFDDENAILAGSYKLQFQQPSITIYKVRHTGVWTYNS